MPSDGTLVGKVLGNVQSGLEVVSRTLDKVEVDGLASISVVPSDDEFTTSRKGFVTERSRKGVEDGKGARDGGSKENSRGSELHSE